MSDTEIITRLIHRLNGCMAKPLRSQQCKTTVYREPARVAYRYLRRFAGGAWHRGGNHVARHNFGPGIAFAPSWVNDKRVKIQPAALNFKPSTQEAA